MNTPVRYYDNTENVPYPAYLCKGKAQQRPGHTHLCRRHIDHDDDHKCICGREWEPLESSAE